MAEAQAVHQSTEPLHDKNIMGDKSPKSQLKNKNQKQSKADASNKKKAGAIASKQQANMAPPKKKK